MLVLQALLLIRFVKINPLRLPIPPMEDYPLPIILAAMYITLVGILIFHLLRVEQVMQ